MSQAIILNTRWRRASLAMLTPGPFFIPLIRKIRLWLCVSEASPPPQPFPLHCKSRGQFFFSSLILHVGRVRPQNQDRQAEGGSDLSDITQNKCG